MKRLSHTLGSAAGLLLMAGCGEATRATTDTDHVATARTSLTAKDLRRALPRARSGLFDAWTGRIDGTDVGYLFGQFEVAGSYSTQFHTETRVAAPGADCVLYESDYTNYDWTQAPPGPSAGTVTLRGASEPISMDPDTTGMYYFYEEGAPLYQPFDRLTLSASGEAATGIAPFTRTQRAPPALIVESASAPLTGAGILDRSHPFWASWTVGSRVAPGAVVRANITHFRSDYAVTIGLSCDFDAAGGVGVIPSHLLALLPPSDAETSSVSIQYAAVTKQTWQQPGATEIGFELAAPGYTTTGEILGFGQPNELVLH